MYSHIIHKSYNNNNNDKKIIKIICASFSYKQFCLVSPRATWRSVQWSAAGVIRHVCVWAQTQVSYVTEGGVGGQRELRLAGLGRPVPGLHDGLAQAGDPLLLAEGVVGLQAVRADLGTPSAAHAETVLH